MQNLRIIDEEAIGVIKIKENSQFNKIKAEKVVVDENTTARLFGSVKTLVLKKGAKLFLHGVISGKIENKGGELFIF
ncbi:MAG TPA: hypothetical protein VN026_03295 [Bacteroidia bacterium]|jgi:hypothetical protein|nr:hypothetical protein [Bacteroidia bacterium]